MAKQESRWLVGIVLAAVAVGVVLRVATLDAKVYWHDEVFTSLRVAGYIGQQVGDSLFTGQQVTAQDLQAFQTFASEARFGDTLASLIDHPEHPPLYYLLAYGWGRLLGPSVAGYRAIAAFFSVLCIPLAALLGRELFPKTPTVGWVAAGLMALSPIQLVYAQEARQYSLWIALTLLSTWLLVRALQRGGWGHWLAYGLALGLGLQTSVMMALVGFSHGLVILLQVPPRRWGPPMGAAGLALLVFSPWLGVMVQHWGRVERVTAWTQQSAPWSLLAKLWGLHYASVVFDPALPLTHPYTVLFPPLVVGLVGWAAYDELRRGPALAARLLVVMLLLPPVLLIGIDLMRNGQMSGTTRYFLSSLVAAQLLLAASIGRALATPPRWVGVGLLTGVLGLGLVAGGLYTRAPAWWNKGISYHNEAIAEQINQAADPLVLSFAGANALGDTISLSYHLNPGVPLRLVRDPEHYQVPEEPADIFLFKPNPDIATNLAERYTLISVPEKGSIGLYRIQPVP